MIISTDITDEEAQALAGVMPWAQWAQMARAVGAVLEGTGHGRVTLVVEAGHPAQLEQVQTWLSADVPAQLAAGLRAATAAGEGAVQVVVRNGRAVHVEVVVRAPVQWPGEVSS